MIEVEQIEKFIVCPDCSDTLAKEKWDEYQQKVSIGEFYSDIVIKHAIENGLIDEKYKELLRECRKVIIELREEVSRLQQKGEL